MRYWLMKSEPDVFGIDHLAASPARTAPWWGVRNYQARNFMRDRMRVGDGVLFYHSSCAEPGIAGLAQVASALPWSRCMTSGVSGQIAASASIILASMMSLA